MVPTAFFHAKIPGFRQVMHNEVRRFLADRSRCW